MNILAECSFLTKEHIHKIEETYNAKYVFESCIKNKNGNWCNFPAAIFYTEEAHPEGSNYFAFYPDYQLKTYMIADGLSAVSEKIEAVQIEGDIIYSRYRHDFREHKGVFVDGGRDYLRYGGQRINESKVVHLIVDKGTILIYNAIEV